MTSFELTKTLVDLVAAYSKDAPTEPLDLPTFLTWASSQQPDDMAKENLKITGFSIAVELAALIGRLSRYSNTYIKLTLEGLPFSTDMEFTFTAILDRNGPLGKTDLIKRMAFDRSSGMGVIRRLLEKELIVEFPNPQDKRSKLLQLTEKGRQAVQLGYQKVPRAANFITAHLDTKEKGQLLHLLQKLDRLHYGLYLSEHQDKALFQGAEGML
ncbi:MAG: winged helix DNA-binding protein [Bacteroidota bacterium]